MSLFPGFVAGSDYWLLSPLAACIEPSNSLRVIPQGGGFRVNLSSVPPSYKVHGVSGNKFFPSSSGSQARIFLRNFLVSLDQHSKGFACVILVFWYTVHDFWREFINLYSYMFMCSYVCQHLCMWLSENHLDSGAIYPVYETESH